MEVEGTELLEDLAVPEGHHSNMRMQDKLSAKGNSSLTPTFLYPFMGHVNFKIKTFGQRKV